MEQLLKALADLLAPYLPKPNISDLEINLKIEKAIEKELTDLDISSEVLNELENYDFDDAIQNYLDYNNYQPADNFVSQSDCEETASLKVSEYIDECLRDEIKDVLRNVTFDV